MTIDYTGSESQVIFSVRDIKKEQHLQGFKNLGGVALFLSEFLQNIN